MYFDNDSIESHILYFDKTLVCQEMAVVGAIENLDEVVSDLEADVDMFKLKPWTYQHVPSHTLWTLTRDDHEHVYFLRVNHAPIWIK